MVLHYSEASHMSRKGFLTILGEGPTTLPREISQKIRETFSTQNRIKGAEELKSKKIA